MSKYEQVSFSSSHAPEGLYHLMARGNNGQAVYLTAADSDAFLTALYTTRERYPFALSAHVLMPNHFHLLVEVQEMPTGQLMQALLTGYVHGEMGSGLHIALVLQVGHPSSRGSSSL